MTNRQFYFSIFVGFLLIALGTGISTQAAIGFGLLSLGLILIGLSMFTRNLNNSETKPIPLESQQD